MRARHRHAIGQDDRHRDHLPLVNAVHEITHFELGDCALAAGRCDGCTRCSAHALRTTERAGALVGRRETGRARRACVHVAAELTFGAALGFATRSGSGASHSLTRRLLAFAVVAKRRGSSANGAARAAVLDVIIEVDALTPAASEATVRVATSATGSCG